MKRVHEARKQQAAAPRRKQRVRSTRPADGKTKRSGGGESSERYWMRCPRCGMGLIETIKGVISTERCTACGAVWADPDDVERAWGDGTPDLFKPFRKG